MNRRRFLTTVGALSFSGCVRTPTASESAFSTLAKTVPGLMSEFNVPGASIASVQNGRLTWTRCFGVADVTDRRPVDDETLFEAASVSKTVFAYAALKLCEKAVIGLDTPLVRYTRQRFTDDPRLDRITARQLLSHSSGLVEWRSRNEPLIQSEPGTRFQYSGEGYYYLQSTLTELLGHTDPQHCATYEADFEVCGTDFDSFMKKRLLHPLGMVRCCYLLGQDSAKHLARPHDEHGAVINKSAPRPSDVARYGAVGGLNITARDYAKFLMEVVSPKAPDEYRLAPWMHREMVRPQIALPEGGQIDGCNAWGLGWGIQDRPDGALLVHSGGQAGFRTLALGCLQTRSGMIMLTNGENGGKVIFHPKVLELANNLITSA